MSSSVEEGVYLLTDAAAKKLAEDRKLAAENAKWRLRFREAELRIRSLEARLAAVCGPRDQEIAR